MRRPMGRILATVAVALAASVAAQAAVLDLATSADGITPDTTSGNFGIALFEWTNIQTTGTGAIDVFAQIQAQGNNDTQEGYNTTENNVFDNGAPDEFNHALALSDIPIVSIGGVDYRQFLLDINEPSGRDSELLSLNEIQVLQSDTANPSTTTFDLGVLDIPGHTFVYRLDDSEDNTIELNAALNNGSGSGDMFMYIPDSAFVPELEFVYLYSSFGDPNSADAGFEEWAVLRGDDGNGVVPEPTSLSLIGIGLVALAGRRLRKRH